MEQKKVMIVDDERDIADLLAGMLEIRFNVTRAYSGINALEQLQKEKQKPDLILLDVFMQDIDGWNVLERIKEDEQLKHIPVVMLTAANPEMKKGIEGYIVKPVTRKELLESVEKIFNSGNRKPSDTSQIADTPASL